MFPYVEEHKFFCDYWFLTRWCNKVREFGALLATHGFLEDAEDVFQLCRHEVVQALEELVLTGRPAARRSARRTGRRSSRGRKELLGELGEWTPPPALGAMPEATNDPARVMLWGVTPERVQEWARAEEGGGRAAGAAASPGVVEGPARVVIDVDQIADVRDGEILVCPITSPAWAPIFPNDHGDRHRHRRRHVARGDRLPRVRAAGGRRDRPRDGADPTGQRIRVDGTAGVRSRSSTGTGDRSHPSARRTCAPPTPRVRRQEREPRRAARGGIPVPPGFAVARAPTVRS